MDLNEARNTPYAWPGGYQLIHLMDDGEVLCNKCIQDKEVHEGGEADGWRYEGSDIHWEGESLYCAHCNAELESEYGIPGE